MVPCEIDESIRDLVLMKEMMLIGSGVAVVTRSGVQSLSLELSKHNTE